LLKATAAAAENCLGLGGGGGWIFFEKINGGGGSAARLTPLYIIQKKIHF
jgi:hypothetical protein